MSLDIKRKEVELMRVECARQELELKIEERLEEIERIKTHIETQKLAEIRIKEEIITLKGR